jgi:hypothetical protein
MPAFQADSRSQEGLTALECSAWNALWIAAANIPVAYTDRSPDLGVFTQASNSPAVRCSVPAVLIIAAPYRPHDFAAPPSDCQV